jgi:hypothetical protein
MVAPNKLNVNRTKKEGQHDVEFAEGGDDTMFGKQAAEPQESGQTSSEDDRGPGAKFAKGGSNKMFGFNPSQPAKAGQTGAR